MEVNEYEQFSNLKIGVPCIVFFLRSDFFPVTKKLANSNDRGYIIRNMNINITADLSYDNLRTYGVLYSTTSEVHAYSFDQQMHGRLII